MSDNKAIGDRFMELKNQVQEKHGIRMKPMAKFQPIPKEIQVLEGMLTTGEIPQGLDGRPWTKLSIRPAVPRSNGNPILD